MPRPLKLFTSVLLTLIPGLAGGLFTAKEIKGWYLQLHKPAWNPPNWIFAPVWTLLYIMMGIALYLVWIAKADADKKRWAIIIFIAQFALNFAWSYIFFHQHQVGWAFIDIVTLWLAIICTIAGFSGISKKAAWLLLPYLLWVSFAAALNYTIWQANI